MPISVPGRQFVGNITQNQSVAPSAFQFNALLLFEAQDITIPTRMIGWLYLHFLRGPQAGKYAVSFVKRAAITTEGALIQVPSIPGIVLPSDQIAGFQLNAYWFEGNREWFLVVQ
jgi:hypothetical protein